MTIPVTHATSARLLSGARETVNPEPRLAPMTRWAAFLFHVALLTILVVGAGFVIASLIDPWVELTVFPLFVMGIIACVWTHGLRSGVPALVLSTLTYWFFFIEPRNSFRLPQLLSALHLAEFVAGGALILFLTRRLRGARDRAKEDRAYLLEVIRQLPSGLRIVRADSGEAVLWNQGVEKVWGPISPPGGALPFEGNGFHPDGRPYQPGEWPLVRALRKGEIVQGERIDVVQPDGARLSVRVNAAPVRDRDGRIFAAVWSFQDVTDLVHKESVVRHMNAELERRVAERTASLETAVRELDSFAYTIAHDLRAPLRGIHGFADLLEAEAGGGLGESGRDCVRRMAQAAKKMDALIVGLLDYCRLARAEFATGSASLGAVCREATEALQEEILASGAEVTIGDSVSFEGAADRLLLRQVVINLLGNAIKFVAPGVRPAVRIRAEAATGGVRLWVEDKGLGIDPQHHERIFGVFQRLNRAEAYPGTGIGLSIVRRAIERMGGRVGLRSEPGKGSAFWVDLPPAVRSANRDSQAPTGS